MELGLTSCSAKNYMTKVSLEVTGLSTGNQVFFSYVSQYIDPKVSIVQLFLHEDHLCSCFQDYLPIEMFDVEYTEKDLHQKSRRSSLLRVSC